MIVLIAKLIILLTPIKLLITSQTKHQSKLLVFGVSFLLCACHPAVKKAASTNQGKLPIPNPCLDKGEQYQVISKIQSRTSYLDKAHPYKPIQSISGFIKQDYNQDAKDDFIFIERKRDKSSKLRLIFCESKNHGYQRRLPPFPLYESDLPDFQTSYQQISLQNNTLTLGDFRHEHNWGSDSTINTYRYNQQLKDFELIRREISSSSGDGLRSDIEESYFLNTRRYIKKSSCGALEDNCHSRYQTGRILALETPPTLFGATPGTKIYKRLIPDQ